MNNNRETRLNEALALLIEGASLSSLSQQYPELAGELSFYEKIIATATMLRGAVPSENGLRRVLDAYKISTPAARPEPSPYLAFFTMYRSALVLPVLLIALIGAGVWRGYPVRAPINDGSVQQTLDSSVQDGSRAAEVAPTDVPAPVAPASFKARQESRMMLMSVPEASSTATSTASTSPEH